MHGAGVAPERGGAIHVKSDREKDDAFAGEVHELRSPREVFVPVFFVETVEEQNHFPRFFSVGGMEDMVWERLVFRYENVGDIQEVVVEPREFVPVGQEVGIGGREGEVMDGCVVS